MGEFRAGWPTLRVSHAVGNKRKNRRKTSTHNMRGSRRAPFVAVYALCQTVLSCIYLHAGTEARDARAIARAVLHTLSGLALFCTGLSAAHSAPLCALAASLACVVDAGVRALAGGTALAARTGERAGALPDAWVSIVCVILGVIGIGKGGNGAERRAMRAHAIGSIMARIVDVSTNWRGAELVGGVIAGVYASETSRKVAQLVLSDGGGRLREARRVLTMLQIEEWHVWRESGGGIIALIRCEQGKKIEEKVKGLVDQVILDNY